MYGAGYNKIASLFMHMGTQKIYCQWSWRVLNTWV